MSLTVPGEWAPHAAMWLGFPSHADLWLDDLEPARTEVSALARALAGPGEERVRLLVCGDEAEHAARSLLEGAAGVEIVRALFGDIWLQPGPDVQAALDTANVDEYGAGGTAEGTGQ